MDQSRPRKAPTPGSWKPGKSGNPAGRPRKGDALAEAIRAEVSPQELIAVAREVIADAKAPGSVRLQAATFLAERGYARPAERHEVAVGQAVDDEPDLSGLTMEQLHELLALEDRRAALLASVDVGVPPAGVKAISDGDGSDGTRAEMCQPEESRG
jgi:hypothetical protein